MEIDFMVAGLSESPNLAANARWVLDIAVREMECPEGLIHRCIIADADNFGSAIAALKPDAGYTNNEAHVAVGKMLRLSDENGRPAFGLVLRDFILGGAWAALAKGFEDRSGVDQRMIYVIWHEVAHVVDAIKRPDHSGSGASTVIKSFKVSEIGARYADIAADEAITCWLSAIIVSQPMLELEINETNDNIVRQLLHLRKETSAYGGNTDQLGRIAWLAAQTFWTILVQHGKIFAFISGNNQLPAAIWLWPSAADGTRDLVSEYGGLLADLFAAYPKTPLDFEQRAVGLWRRLAGLHGFTFPERTHLGDGVFWDETWRNLMLAPENPS